jgi:hypothetical protein
MTNELTDQQMDSDCPLIYQVRLKGHLGKEWGDWFGNLTITLDENGETILSGPALDQAALYGLLKKIRDLGITLISVNPIETDQADSSEAKQSNPMQ